MKLLKIILTVFTVAMVSCDNETSLQEYYVENQNNKQFLALDIPASLLTGEQMNLTAEQRATLETIRKVNLLGFPMNDKNQDSYEEEKSKITGILKSEKYRPLIKYGGDNRNAELYYLGEEDAIDEFIIFGADEEKGFGVARVLGEDMKPEDLIRLLRSFEEGELNVQGLQNFSTMFKD